jgi:hypothetical protein
MDINQLLLIAFLVESFIQTIKPIYDRQKGWNKDSMISLIIGISLCLLVKINLFAFLNLPVLIGDPVISEYVGIVLTGIIASRGANLAHDLLKFVQTSSASNIVSAVG